jgi:uncharacterized protein (TIGR02646 family)
MRAITKLPEPPSLTQHRATPHADYENYADKDTLRARLVFEQRGLCCFCGGRIIADKNRMKVAHWMPKTPNPQFQLDYWNLLGACPGNTGQPKKKQHCDTHQGDNPLSRNPANPDHRIEDFIQFLPDGTITSNDPALAQELGRRKADGDFEEGVLNLNLPFLRTNRMKSLNAFTKGLSKRGHLSKPALGKLISRWRGDGPGELEAYAPVVVYWLRKRLARA